MDNNNWRPIQGGEPPAMDTVDWRTQLQPDSRQQIVNKFMDSLKKHLPFTGPEGLREIRKIAERFEERMYSATTSQSDYLRKISLKMLTMETKSVPECPTTPTLSEPPPPRPRTTPYRRSGRSQPTSPASSAAATSSLRLRPRRPRALLPPSSTVHEPSTPCGSTPAPPSTPSSTAWTSAWSSTLK